jgi:hypothetical protein
MAGNSRGSGAIAPAEFTTGLGFQTDIVEPVDITSLLDRLPEPESDGAAMMRGFFLRAAAAGPFIRSLAEQWRPDVILRDTAGQDAWAVAELLDTPLATFDFTPALSGMTQQVAAGELTWFRHEMGLPADPGFERLHSQLTIVGAPPTWFDGHHLPANTHFVQPVEPDPLPGESPLSHPSITRPSSSNASRRRPTDQILRGVVSTCHRTPDSAAWTPWPTPSGWRDPAPNLDTPWPKQCRTGATRSCPAPGTCPGSTTPTILCRDGGI